MLKSPGLSFCVSVKYVRKQSTVTHHLPIATCFNYMEEKAFLVSRDIVLELSRFQNDSQCF